LLGLNGSAQSTLAREVARNRLSVRETEALVKRRLNPTATPKVQKKDVDITRLESDLAERLGAQVSLRQQGKNKGVLEIHYSSLEALDGILARIK
jgi:ParB family chromosome partitioning protein